MDDLSLLLPSATREAPPGSPATFLALLLHPAPPPGLLRDVKDFSKLLIARGASAFPEPVAHALYYACLAAAERSGVRISELPRADRRRGFLWAMEQPWITGELRQLFEQALRCDERNPSG